MLVCFLPVRSFFRPFVRSCLCLFVCVLVRSIFVLRDCLVGNATARVIRNRIYEATGGKSQDVGRQIGHRHTVKDKGPQEATGFQISAQEATKGKIPAWEAPNPT